MTRGELLIKSAMTLAIVLPFAGGVLQFGFGADRAAVACVIASLVTLAGTVIVSLWTSP